jgi:hypothetical protein
MSKFSRLELSSTFCRETMDMGMEMGIIVSGMSWLASVPRDDLSRRLPDIHHPLTRKHRPLLCSGPVATPSGVRRGFLLESCN